MSHLSWSGELYDQLYLTHNGSWISYAIYLHCILLRKTPLTHWGRVTHICVSILTIIGSDNGLSPGRRQAIIWTNAGILLIGPLGTNFSEILIKIHTFSFKKMWLKVSTAKWRPSCLGLNVLIHCGYRWHTFGPTNKTHCRYCFKSCIIWNCPK